jgi:SET domain-containing protein
MRGMVDCSKVYVDTSDKGGAGVFAAVAIAAGEIVERGIVRRLPSAFDGNSSPYVFTWSEDRTVWAIGSGASTFYNSSDTPNTKMHRHFDSDTFEIFALRDIAAGEELTHTYMSLAWRSCFADLREG